MTNENIFIGTLNELAYALLKEYVTEKSFTVYQINYSPSEDCSFNEPINAALSANLSLTLSGKNDKQLENKQLFSDDYLSEFEDKRLHKGQVYQLTFISAYIDEYGETKVSYPLVPGRWAFWESYWAENTPSYDCVAFAAVNILKGMCVSPQARWQINSENVAYHSEITDFSGSVKEFLDDYFEDSQEAFSEKQDKSLYFNEVSASSWTSDTTYAGYGYKCEISLTGVTAAMVPYITLGHTEAVSGNYSPVALSGTGTITIYSKVNTSITIPLIKAEVV